MTTLELLLYLLRCELNGLQPQPEPLSPEILTELYELSRKHSLAAICAYALEDAGIVDPRFQEAKYRAIYKNAQLLTAGDQVCAYLEQSGIRHMPLKGMLLQELYSRPGMRQMTDCDILFDEAARQYVHDWFLQNGYAEENEEHKRHISYFKEPVLNIEMHLALFRRYAGWLADTELLWKRLQVCEGSESRYGFTVVDGYVYLAAHACRHLQSKGTGIRSLADIYLYRHAHAANLSEEAILHGLREAEIETEAVALGELAMKLFSAEGGTAGLTAEERLLLGKMTDSGTYGSVEGNVRRKLQDLQNGGNQRTGAKLRYILRRLFPTKQQFPEQSKFFYRHPILLPIYWIFRMIRGLFHPTKYLKQELRYLFHRK